MDTGSNVDKIEMIARRALESEALTLDNTCLYAHKWKLHSIPIKLKKLFQGGGKKNPFTCGDITGIHVEFESRFC